MRFAAVGGICFLVGLFVQWIFFSIFQFHYLIGYAVAVLVTSIINWALNRKWTFRSRDFNRLGEAARHQGVNLSALGVSTGLFILFVSGFGIHYMVAHISIGILMLAINFFLQRRFVYRKR